MPNTIGTAVTIPPAMRRSRANRSSATPGNSEFAAEVIPKTEPSMATLAEMLVAQLSLAVQAPDARTDCCPHLLPRLGRRLPRILDPSQSRVVTQHRTRLG